MTLILLGVLIACAITLVEVRGVMAQLPVPLLITCIVILLVFSIAPVMYLGWEMIYAVASGNAGAAALGTAIRSRYGLQ